MAVPGCAAATIIWSMIPDGNLGEFVLGVLADQGEPIGVHVQTSEEEHGFRDADFQGGAAGEAASDAEGIADEDVHAGEGDAGSDQFGGDAADVIAPLRFGSLDFLLDGKLHGVFGENRRGDADQVVVAGAAGDDDLGLDRHGEDEAFVVIGVLADKIDAAGGADEMDAAGFL